ncbi:MAG: hypothetical protein M3Q68_01230 [Actinomycetota bacterium]|nr:hypothetical protein [Actinomycetota bacterium]
MARIHGKSGRLYAAIASGGAAEPIAFLNAWTIDFSTDKADVTAFGDTNKVYSSGLPDSQGTFGGFYDTATAQLYTASQDGVARKFYLYPDNATTGQYWYGTALFDFSVSGGVGDAVGVSGAWNAAGAITKIG